MLLLLLGSLLPAAASSTTAAGETLSPFYMDPLFSAAHDPELVFNRREGCYWLLYLQNRYNSPASDPHPLGFTSLTDIGLASTPDGGRHWVYRGVALGLDVPAGARHARPPPSSAAGGNGTATSGTQQFGGATWWRPAVTYEAGTGTYHAFWVYWEPGRGMRGPDGPGAYANWNVVHYESQDLKQWHFAQFVRKDSFAYDSDVFRVADGRYILFSTGQTRPVHGSPKPLQSRDLRNWTVCTGA